MVLINESQTKMTYALYSCIIPHEYAQGLGACMYSSAHARVTMKIRRSYEIEGRRNSILRDRSVKHAHHHQFCTIYTSEPTLTIINSKAVNTPLAIHTI